MELPSLPADFGSFIPALQKHAATQTAVAQAVEPYKAYESKLRHIYAQDPQNDVAKQSHLVSVFDTAERLTTRARDTANESQIDKDKVLLPLADGVRRDDGSPATVDSLKDFRTNFNLFSESSLVDLDWSNVIAAGSAVVTALLPVGAPHNESKRALRSYYHEKLAPASDVDLFLYGLTEAEAIVKIKKIEAGVRDSVLSETTTIRTKNAITIVSEYPTRHVQIVLRLYNSITEILTGFDVDCACVAYDGQQVWAAPRALAAFATQTNTVDLTRRSPSYENRLSKYAHRGFEVLWPGLDRSRIDPTIYERSFGRVMGLARLLVLEKLPHPSDRDQFLAKRRAERGRPELPWTARYRHALPGNVKDAQPDDVAEWYDEDEVSSYHTFTIPYGPKYTAKKVEKLLFKKDLLLNAEWNRSKDRETKLHRHPAFFGNVEDVIHDCCGFCPSPSTDADLAAYEEESKLYISGDLIFMKDDPGRQAVGSFNPLTDDDWTDMAYVGNTTVLCQAIVDNDLESVKDWFSSGGGDVNRRDHTGRTPLQLAAMSSNVDIVQYLIDHGARLVSRIYSGMTALHMAAHRGDIAIVKALLDKSIANEKEEDRKEDVRKDARRAAVGKTAQDKQNTQDNPDEDANMKDDDGDDEEAEEIEMEDESDSDDNMTQGSFVKVPKEEDHSEGDDADEPDFYSIDVLAWDAPVSPLHLAIIGGHVEVIELLIESYGADAMLPVKLLTDYIPRKPRAAILSLVLPIRLSSERADRTIRTLIKNGASTAQADTKGATAVHHIVNNAKHQILDLLQHLDDKPVDKVIMNRLLIDGSSFHISIENPLVAAVRTGSIETVHQVLAMGATPEIDFETFAKAFNEQKGGLQDPDEMNQKFRTSVDQPVIEAAKRDDMADVITRFIELGVDVNSLSKGAYMQVFGTNHYYWDQVKSLLDLVRDRIEALQEYSSSESQDDKPVKPEDLPSTSPASLGKYQTWLAHGNLASAEAIHTLQSDKYQENLKDWMPKKESGSEEKKTAVQNMRTKYQELALNLVAKGAKTFKELHPKEAQDDNQNRTVRHGGYYGNANPRTEPYKNKMTFLVPDLTDKKKASYNQLFEASFDGDTATVKMLCIEGRDRESPLQVAVQDLAGFSPFSIAIIRGHNELATTILEIAAAQYQPPKDDGTQYKFTMHRPYDDNTFDSSDDSSDDDSVQVYQELVDADFTIDDVRALASNVKSKVSPITMFMWDSEVWRAMDASESSEDAKAIFKPNPRQRNYQFWSNEKKSPWPWFHQMMDFESSRCRWSLFRYAIAKNNIGLIKYLLRVNKDLRYRRDDATTLETMQLREADIEFALQLGRTEITGEIIRQTGALMPLQNLAQKTGVQIEAKPEYYQGLSVHGQKRADWAQAGRGNHTEGSRHNGSPLLNAIMSGNLESVEYFLSDTPLRRYEEFIEAFKHDKRIQSLAAAKGGINQALSTWMSTRIHLAIHIAVMASRSSTETLIEYLIKKLPQHVDSKSEAGDTPLHAAFRLKNYEGARLLIAAGADQTTRDKEGQNLAHTIYTSDSYTSDPGKFQQLIEMLDPKTVQSLLTQRCNSREPSSQTPFALFCDQQSLTNTNILQKMLALSQGKDLQIMDGAGDYPLHRLVREAKTEMATYIATQFHHLLFLENATGMTPIDVAETASLKHLISNPPEVNIRRHNSQAIHKNLRDRPSHEFLPEDLQNPRKEREPLHTILRAIADKHPHPRKLVGLLDANEVARRLAEQQQKANKELKEREALGLKSYSGYSRYDQKKDESEDEVKRWWGRAYAE